MSKPIIRHCKNCEWSIKKDLSLTCGIVCKVTYDYIPNDRQRAQALFCRHFKKRSDDNAT